MLFFVDVTLRFLACLLCIAVSASSYIVGVGAWLFFMGLVPGVPGLGLTAQIIACFILGILGVSSFRLGGLSQEAMLFFLDKDRPDWGGSLFS